MRRRSGFTLIEVLVALAVIAIAMAAAVRVSSQVIGGSHDLKLHLAAGWVAQNRLNSHLVKRLFPAVGLSQGEEDQAGLHFVWREEVSETPNRAFHRVEVKVYADKESDYAVTTLVGYLADTNG